MFDLRFSLHTITSAVPKHKGECLFTWKNKNQIDNRLDGGISGFFRSVEPTFIPCVHKMKGEEFHGIVLWNSRRVTTTELPENLY